MKKTQMKFSAEQVAAILTQLILRALRNGVEIEEPEPKETPSPTKRCECGSKLEEDWYKLCRECFGKQPASRSRQSEHGDCEKHGIPLVLSQYKPFEPYCVSCYRERRKKRGLE